MNLDEIKKIKHDNATLVDTLDKLLDYIRCMKLATQYKTKNEPDLMAIGRTINKYRSEYCENK